MHIFENTCLVWIWPEWEIIIFVNKTCKGRHYGKWVVCRIVEGYFWYKFYQNRWSRFFVKKIITSGPVLDYCKGFIFKQFQCSIMRHTKYWLIADVRVIRVLTRHSWSCHGAVATEPSELYWQCIVVWERVWLFALLSPCVMSMVAVKMSRSTWRRGIMFYSTPPPTTLSLDCLVLDRNASHISADDKPLKAEIAVDLSHRFVFLETS